MRSLQPPMDRPNPATFKPSTVSSEPLSAQWNLALRFALATLVFFVCIGWTQIQGESEGFMATWTYDSTKHGPVSYMVYTPPGYFSPGNNDRYPVLYFLHGSGDDETAFAEALDRLPTAGDDGAEKMDDAILSGLLPPMILVSIGAPGGSWTEELDELVVETLVDHVDRNWRTIADRRGRSIEGFSAGAQGVARYLTPNPERFASVSILGGGFENWRWLDHSTNIRLRGVRVNILSGSGDQFLAGAQELHDLLDLEGIENQFEAVPGVGHSGNSLYQTRGLQNLQFHADAWLAESVADAGPDLVLDRGAPDSAQLNGEILDGGTYATDWQQIDGPGQAGFTNTLAPGTSITFPELGTYTLRFSATDAAGTYDDVMTVAVLDLDDSLQMHLPLDNDAQDVTGNGNDGQEQGATQASSGKIGGSYHFDGTDDLLVVQDFDYGSQLSVAFWFKPVDLGGSSYQYLFSHNGFDKSHSLNVYLPERSTSSNGKMRSVLRDANDGNGQYIDAPGDYEDGGWHHYTMTIGTGGSRVYIDGREEVISYQGGDTFNPGTDLVLGGRSVSPANRYFEGWIDDVRLYTRELEAAEAYLLGHSGITDQVPAVDAGQDLSIQDTEDALLTATVSDDGVSPLSLTWSRISGPGTVDFSHPTSPSTSAAFETAGIYELRLSATDGQGSDFDSISVTVQSVDAPVGHWLLNELSGSIAQDESLQGNDGTLIGSSLPVWTGSGLHFDWTASQAVILGQPQSLNLAPADTDLSLLAWIRVDPGAEGTIISKAYGSLSNRQFQLYLYDNNGDGRSSLYGLIGGKSNNNASAAVIDDGQWHLVAVVHDADTMSSRMYVDGQAQGGWKASGTATNSVDVMLGARRNTWYNTGIGWAFDGEIGEAAIYARTLSDDDLMTLYAQGPG